MRPGEDPRPSTRPAASPGESRARAGANPRPSGSHRSAMQSDAPDARTEAPHSIDAGTRASRSADPRSARSTPAQVVKRRPRVPRPKAPRVHPPHPDPSSVVRNERPRAGAQASPAVARAPRARTGPRIRAPRDSRARCRPRRARAARGGARGPAGPRQIGRLEERGPASSEARTLLGCVDPRSVRGHAAQRQRRRVAQLEGRERRGRKHEKHRAHDERPHRSSTVRAMFPPAKAPHDRESSRVAAT